MSGHKRKFISISEDEYRRLCDADLRLRSVSEKVQDNISGIRSASERALWENLNQAYERQNAFESSIQSMNEELVAVEAAANQTLLEFESETYQNLQGALDDLWKDAQLLIDERARVFEAEIAELNRRRGLKLRRMAQQLSLLEDETTRKRNLAVEWLQSAVDICHFIATKYPHERFVPGELKRLYEDTTIAEQNIELGFYEAAFASAQEIFNQVSELRVVLERCMHDWQIHLQTALSRGKQLLVLAEDSQACKAVDLEGKVLPIDIDVNYWSGGKFQHFFLHLRKMVHRLEHRPEIFDMSSLKTIIQQHLPEMQKELDDIITDARWAALSSQLRINIADIAIQALEEQGFELVDSKYTDEDQRQGYSASVKDYSGNQVYIYVEQVAGQPVQTELHVQSEDSDRRTEYELRRRDVEITQALMGYGLRVYKPVQEEQVPYPGKQVSERLEHPFEINDAGIRKERQERQKAQPLNPATLYRNK